MTTSNKQKYLNTLIFSTIFFLFSFNLQAQKFADKEFYLIDSLVLEDLSEYNRTKLDSIITLYHESKTDTAQLHYLKFACQKLTNQFIFKRYNKILKERALKGLSEKKHSKEKKNFYKDVLGYYYALEGFIQTSIYSRPDSAILYYKKALEIYKDLNELDGVAHLYSAIGFEYADQSKTIKALEYYDKSLKISEKANTSYSPKNILFTLSYLVQLNYEIRNYETANELIERGTLLADSLKDDRMLATFLDLKTTILAKQKKYETASILSLEIVKLTKNASDQTTYGNALALAGNMYLEVDELDSAELYLNNSLIYFGDYKNNIAISLAGLGRLAIKRKNYKEAKRNGLKILEITKNEARIREASKILKEVYKQENNLGEYIKYSEMYDEYYKLMHNDKAYSAILKQSIQFNFEKQKEIDDLENQQKLDLASQEKKRTQLALIAAAIIAFLIALFSIFIFNRLKLIRKQKTELDSAYEQLEESKKNELAVSNLKALQSQMNPHFIFNALNSVQDLVLLKDIRNSNKYLGKFSDLIRKILLSSKQQFISLEEEVEILSLYLDLEKLRFGDDFVIDLQCNVSQEQQEDIKLPAMFIQPYIENAIKHGLFHKEGVKELLVHFNIKNNALECIIKDNGIGQEKAAEFKVKRLHLHTGFSTEAINERIRLLNQTLVKKIELKIEDLVENGKAAGTKITLQFPIEL